MFRSAIRSGERNDLDLSILKGGFFANQLRDNLMGVGLWPNEEIENAARKIAHIFH